MNKIFNIFPLSNDSRYYKVQIFESKIEYYNYLYKNSIQNHCSFVPFSASIEYIENNLFNLGIISFYRSQYLINCIFHECLHAAIWYLKKTYATNPFTDWNKNYTSCARQMEERLASIQEYLFLQIINTDNKFGFVDLKSAEEHLNQGLQLYNWNQNINANQSNQQELEFY